ncbi:beta-defensin 104A-like [Otolemur garnettii]|uniref:beta-defensin 104A-like n=1 Tax=Otolemur garnettii TaxID=30611 RepID=UPI0001514413|nr:beta-defensin 104A-like [Otolemur garnettii]
MRITVLLLAISLLLYQDPPVRSEFEVDRICGHGTARCRKKCKIKEYKIGLCLNTNTCCLMKWIDGMMNFTGS